MKSHSDPPPAAQDSGPGDVFARSGAYVGVLRAAYIAADVALTVNDVSMIRRALAGIRADIAEVLPDAVTHRSRSGPAAARAAAILRGMKSLWDARSNHAVPGPPTNATGPAARIPASGAGSPTRPAQAVSGTRRGRGRP